MQTYNIEMEIDNEYKNSRWYGYTEQVAIAQAMLSEAQGGARKVEILSIKEI